MCVCTQDQRKMIRLKDLLIGHIINLFRDKSSKCDKTHIDS